MPLPNLVYEVVTFIFVFLKASLVHLTFSCQLLGASSDAPSILISCPSSAPTSCQAGKGGAPGVYVEGLLDMETEHRSQAKSRILAPDQVLGVPLLPLLSQPQWLGISQRSSGHSLNIEFGGSHANQATETMTS